MSLIVLPRRVPELPSKNPTLKFKHLRLRVLTQETTVV